MRRGLGQLIWLGLILVFLYGGEATAEECGPWTERALEARSSADEMLPSGVMAAEPRARSVVIWTRTEEAEKLRLITSAGPECGEREGDWVRTREEDFFTATFPLDDLEPGRLYKYWVEVKGAGRSSPGWFKTLPEADVAVRIAFSADVSKKKRYYSLFPHLAELGADYYIAMGDWPNADGAGPVSELEVFYKKYSRSRRNHSIQRWMKTVGIGAIWDDHEVRNNWDGELKEEFPEVVERGTKVWHEFFPVVGAPAGEIYRKHMVGPEIEVFLLDLRSHRDANDADDEGEKSMLGAGQKAWLFEGLKGSEATFKIVVTSVAFYHGTTGDDHWEGFTQERDELFAFIEEAAIENIVFLAADQHWLSVQHLPQGFKFYQVGPLGHKTRSPKRGVPRWVRLVHQAMNFGYLDYEPAEGGRPARLRFRAFGNATEGREDTEDAVLLYEEEILAGRASLEVLEDDPYVDWLIEGAHTFVGDGSFVHGAVPPGEYTITWRHVVPELIEIPGETKEVADDGALAFRLPTLSEAPAPSFEERFDSDPLARGWSVRDEGVAVASSDWRLEGGEIVERGNCYDVEDSETASERKRRRERGEPKPIALAKRGTILIAEAADFGEGALFARFYPGDDDAFGLVYGVDGERYYRVSFDQDREYARLVKVEVPIDDEDDGFRLLAERRGFDFPTQWTTVVVLRRGETHQVYFDGELILEAKDDALPLGGAAGIYAWGMDELRVDDFAVFGGQ